MFRRNPVFLEPNFSLLCYFLKPATNLSIAGPQKSKIFSQLDHFGWHPKGYIRFKTKKKITQRDLCECNPIRGSGTFCNWFLWYTKPFRIHPGWNAQTRQESVCFTFLGLSCESAPILCDFVRHVSLTPAHHDRRFGFTTLWATKC